MVGVPGRSKACVTCLKRKKRCDLQKPFCGTCRKACLDCGGYYRPRIFINKTLQNPHAKERTVGSGKSQIAHGNVVVALSPSLARSAYQTKYLDLFWRLYLPNGVALSSQVTQPALGGWLEAVQGLYSTDSVLEKALLAMSLTVVGKHDGDRSLMEEGMKLYASSLQNMAVALKNPQRAMGDGLLTAIRIFSLYESMHGSNDTRGLPQARSWVVHNSGDSALLVARSPYSFVTGYSHRLFVDGRLHLALSALGTRKRIFLAEPEWMTIPWSEYKKSPRDYLVDIIIDISPLFEDMDIMNACKDIERKETSRQHLITQCIQLNQRLLDWQACYAPLDFEPGAELPAVITPYKLTAAHLITLFWTTSIVVGSNLNILLGPDEAFHTGMDLDLFCGNIIRTIPFFCQPSMGLFRAHVTTYPLTVALHYIRSAGPTRMIPERRLLADCLNDPACAGIRQFITSMSDQFEEFL